MKAILRDVLQLMLWLYRYLRSLPYKRSRIEKQAGKKILLVGNGPSLSSFDFRADAIKGFDVLCVNMFAIMHPEFFEIKPRYYCIIDPGFFEKNEFVTKETEEKIENVVKSFERVDWRMTIVTHSANKLELKNELIDCIYINKNIYTGGLMRYFLYKNNMACMPHLNVLNGALYYAITAGYMEIYLAGADFSFIKNIKAVEDNRVIYHDAHFDDVDKEGRRVVVKHSLSDMLDGASTALKCFSAYNGYAEHMGVKVYNSTPGSFIDAFERKAL